MEHKWINHSDVLSMFPTPVWKFELTAEAQETLNKDIMGGLEGIRPTGEPPTTEAWQSDQDLHKLEQFRGLVTYIDDTVPIILRFLKIAYDAFEITGAGPVTISDLTGATTAADLGLDVPGGFPGAATAGLDIDACVRAQTLLTSLPGLTQPLGTIRLSIGG